MNAAPQPDTAYLEALFERQQQRLATLRTSSADQRILKLRALRDALLAHRGRIQDALFADFRKPPEEVDLSELGVVLAEISHAVKHLRHWMKPHRTPTPVPYVGTSVTHRVEPKGVVLIVSPWNYPVNLALAPLVSAVAAGNCAILKPSELTPATSRLLSTLIAEVFDEEEVTVVEGNADTARALLELPFNHIFFTGSPRVGRLVMAAAARHLTSVTLELGGKSPTLVDGTTDLALTARRIAFGKFANAGQTCIAPDYVLVARPALDPLLHALDDAIHAFYGSSDPSPSLAAIVNEAQLDRLDALLQDALARGARCTAGGRIDRATMTFSPTVLTDVPPEARLLKEEIFGPILPVLAYDRLEDAIAFVNALPPALTTYVFSNDPKVERAIRTGTTSGSLLVNDTLIHFGHPDLPFGGVQDSGVGRSHGRAGFLAFSNERPVMRQRVGQAALFGRLFPPYSRTTRWVLDILLRWYRR